MPDLETSVRDALHSIDAEPIPVPLLEPDELRGRAVAVGPDGRGTPPWPAWLAIAAAILAFALAGGTWLWMTNPGPVIGTPAAPSGSPGLTGVRWDLTAINGLQAISSNDGVPYLIFADDGVLIGGDPCNALRGRYRLTGDALTLSDVAVTEMACGDTAVVKQQSAFGAALMKVARVQRSALSLVLYGADGSQLLTFVERMLDASPGPLPTPVPSPDQPTSNSSPTGNKVLIAIRNDTSISFDGVRVRFPDTVVSYGPLAPGAASRFERVTRAYSYAAVVVRVGVKEYTLQPIDYVGEELLAPGRYLYALTLTKGQLEITLVKG